MATILLIETATAVCSVGLCSENGMIAHRETLRQNSHASKVAVFIDEVLKDGSTEVAGLDAVAVSMGPGSYTGLRIGVSSAKGLCYALNIPLIALGTLECLARGMLADFPPSDENTLYLPMIDARRMEVYLSVFDRGLNAIKVVNAEIITPGHFDEFLPATLVLGGDGASKTREVLKYAGKLYYVKTQPSVAYMMEAALHAYSEKQFVDTAYFEPFYLKDFVAGKPKVKGLK